MTYHEAKLRSAMTAIAVVLAISSTPLLAQDAGLPEPAPESTTEPATSDPLAPEPTAPETPVVTDTATPPAQTSEPAAKPKAAARRPAAAARPFATRSSGAATTAPAVISAPAAEELIDAPVAAPVNVQPVAQPATVPAATAVVDQAQAMDDMLELTGAAGAGLLALAGAGLALRRRKRRKEEERVEEAKWAIIEAAPDVETQVEREPAFTRVPAPAHDPVPANRAAPTGAPVTRLPNGFDLSRFGPHVQAAYRGPTPDNPSLSLKYRLRRASALDQQARQAANQAATRPVAPAPARPAWAQPAQAARDEVKFMLRRAGTNNGAKPAFQR